MPYSLTYMTYAVYMQKQYPLLQCNCHHFSICLHNCIIIVYLVQVSRSLALFRLFPCWFLIFLCFFHHIMRIHLMHFLRLDPLKWPRNRTSSKIRSRATPKGWAMLNSKGIGSNFLCRTHEHEIEYPKGSLFFFNITNIPAKSSKTQ